MTPIDTKLIDYDDLYPNLEDISSKISDYKDSVYERDYSKDVPVPPQKESVLQRVTLAVIPLLAQIDYLRYPITLAMGTIRVWNSKENLHLCLSTISLISSIFKQRVGKILTTVHDIVLEVKKIAESQNLARSFQKPSQNFRRSCLPSFDD